MDKSSSSPAFRDDESFLAMAHGRKTSFEDLTFRSSPGSPVAASTVVRPVVTNPDENKRFVDFLRGYCTPNQKLACFCALSQNYPHLFEK